MPKSKLLVTPELLAELLSLPMGVEIVGAGIEVDGLRGYGVPTLFLTIEGDKVPASAYSNVVLEQVVQKAVRFVKFEEMP